MEVNLLYIINDFIVNFNLFNASFLNKLINFFKKIIVMPNFWTVVMFIHLAHTFIQSDLN